MGTAMRSIRARIAAVVLMGGVAASGWAIAAPLAHADTDADVHACLKKSGTYDAFKQCYEDKVSAKEKEAEWRRSPEHQERGGE